MKVFSLISCVLLAAVAVVAEEQAPQTVDELQIDTTYEPSECTVKAQRGDKIEVHYTGTLFANGKKFDSSLDRGDPFALILGVGQVIPGWDQGLAGMCVNEKRKLTIPSRLAYGSRGFGSIIPPNSALVFEVEMLKLDRPDPQPERVEL